MAKTKVTLGSAEVLNFFRYRDRELVGMVLRDARKIVTDRDTRSKAAHTLATGTDTAADVPAARKAAGKRKAAKGKRKATAAEVSARIKAGIERRRQRLAQEAAGTAAEPQAEDPMAGYETYDPDAELAGVQEG